MLKKRSFLICGIAALLSFNQVFAQAAHEPYGPDTGWHPEGHNLFEIGSADGKYRLGFRGLLQQNNQFTIKPNSTDKKWQPDFDMNLNNAGFGIYGSLHPRLTYLFQLAVIDNKDVQVPNFYANLLGFRDWLQVRIGKFSTPFTRYQLMSPAQTQFYNHHEAQTTFKVGDDVGFMVHNGFDRTYEWALALVNSGIVGRFGYNHGDINGYELVDFTGGGLRFGVAGNGALVHKKFSFKNFKVGADAIVKYEGFSSNGAFYYDYKLPDVPKGDGTHTWGFGIDAGYLLKKHYEPTIRFSLNKSPSANLGSEILGGFNYYLYGHHLKAQGYAGVKLTDQTIQQWLAGVQLQLAI